MTHRLKTRLPVGLAVLALLMAACSQASVGTTASPSQSPSASPLSTTPSPVSITPSQTMSASPSPSATATLSWSEMEFSGAIDGVWWASSVRVIVRRADPTVQAMLPTRDYRRGSDFILAKLLRCPTCGTRMSGTRDRVDGPNRGRVRYACRLGTVTPHHRITISEHLILPVIRAEADRLRTPDELHMTPDVQERQRLEDRRVKILDMYESGDITKQEKAERLETVFASMRKLDAHRIVIAVPDIDWDAEPRKLNAVLRALFSRIDLDPETFQPVGFEWHVPEWRR